jgi:NAD(P)-dependent dehydrogenase (short-subunit alcohol dehydrogenase family)
MNTPVVLITGALTGIGRATAIAFAREGARIVISGRRDEVGQKLVTELPRSALKQSIGVPTCVTRTMCATWSIRPSRTLVVWI